MRLIFFLSLPKSERQFGAILRQDIARMAVQFFLPELVYEIHHHFLLMYDM